MRCLQLHVDGIYSLMREEDHLLENRLFHIGITCISSLLLDIHIIGKEISYMSKLKVFL